MSAKFGARRRAAFVSGLAATGNYTIAAARAKVSRSWVNLHRRDDAAFRAACDAAMTAARAAFATHAELPRKLAFHDGAELVVRGGNARRAVVARARCDGWSPRLEHEFVAELAAHGNVRRACGTIGLSVAAAYAHRKRWPAFGARWATAITVAEEKLIEDVVDSLLREPGDDFDRPMPPLDKDEVWIRLGLFQARRRTVKRPGFPHLRAMGLDRPPALSQPQRE